MAREPMSGSGPTLCVVGGAGHVGLPLAIVFASKGERVLVHDIDTRALAQIAGGVMPFMDRGAEPLLREALRKGTLVLTSDAKHVAGIPVVVLTIGTPIDEFWNPSPKALLECVEQLLPYLSEDQLVILRSTVSPGTTEWLDRYLATRGRPARVAFCPERVVQGQAVEEVQSLPQIVSGTTRAAEDQAAEVFSRITSEVIRLAPMEAEFAKLFCNAYRYIQFAVSNQFFMMANSAGLDYARILDGMKRSYGRSQGVPSAGFAAGPCLFKDTMQLTAFAANEFGLGSTAMLINEGLPLYIVDRIALAHDLPKLTVGLLGMAFKADSDDPRSSLSYKLKKVLRFRAREVLTTDPYVKDDPDLISAEDVVAKSDVLIVCAPHGAYRTLDLRGRPVVDIWNFLGRGTRVDGVKTLGR
jgi:UDP-N-acetyl-D-mannosaminuronic acid dehydrogenase